MASTKASTLAKMTNIMASTLSSTLTKTLASMSMEELKEMCEYRGFSNYAACGKWELIYLLENGVHMVYYAPYHAPYGPKNEDREHVLSTKKVEGGLMLRGVNLEGMFEARWDPEVCVFNELKGAWFIPEKHFAAFREFYRSLMVPKVPSLFACATKVIAAKSCFNEENLTKVLPPQIHREVKETKTTLELSWKLWA